MVFSALQTLGFIFRSELWSITFKSVRHIGRIVPDGRITINHRMTTAFIKQFEPLVTRPDLGLGVFRFTWTHYLEFIRLVRWRACVHFGAGLISLSWNQVRLVAFSCKIRYRNTEFNHRFCTVVFAGYLLLIYVIFYCPLGLGLNI